VTASSEQPVSSPAAVAVPNTTTLRRGNPYRIQPPHPHCSAYERLDSASRRRSYYGTRPGQIALDNGPVDHGGTADEENFL
jgi:hypothetical protein